MFDKYAGEMNLVGATTTQTGAMTALWSKDMRSAADTANGLQLAIDTANGKIVDMGVNATTMGNIFGLTKQQTEILAQSLNIDLSKGLTTADVVAFQNAVAAAGGTANIVTGQYEALAATAQAKMQLMAATAATAMPQVSTAVSTAVNNAIGAFSGAPWAGTGTTAGQQLHDGVYNAVNPIIADLASIGARAGAAFGSAVSGAVAGAQSAVNTAVTNMTTKLNIALHGSPQYVTYHFGEGLARDLVAGFADTAASSGLSTALGSLSGGKTGLPSLAGSPVAAASPAGHSSNVTLNVAPGAVVINVPNGATAAAAQAGAQQGIAALRDELRAGQSPIRGGLSH